MGGKLIVKAFIFTVKGTKPQTPKTWVGL